MQYSKLLLLVSLLFASQAYSETIYVDVTGDNAAEPLYYINVGDWVVIYMSEDPTGEMMWSPYSSDSSVIAWSREGTTALLSGGDLPELTLATVYEGMGAGTGTVYMFYMDTDALLDMVNSGTFTQEAAEAYGYYVTEKNVNVEVSA